MLNALSLAKNKTGQKPVRNPNRETYVNPLPDRYASSAMSVVFSDRCKFETFRRCWVALAEAQRELGLDIITQEQIDELTTAIEKIDYARAEQIEAEIRHDVMSHIRAYGEQCPKAQPIIHLGATSEFLNGNTEIIQMKTGLIIIRESLIQALEDLKVFAITHKDLPALGYTHLQPAQLVTVGKRAMLWLQDFAMDLERLQEQIDKLALRGAKGTTGTQDSYLKLFSGDHEKVKQLDVLVCKKLGFDKVMPISGQTYTRKIDQFVLDILSGIAASAHKMGSDLRILQNFLEVQEPSEEKQVGSSAMAYKSNPMRSERMCSLAEWVMTIAPQGARTHANQNFERTLNDSAVKRMSIPEAFLAVDAILTILRNLAKGLKVNPKVIAARVQKELPFMATEEIMMLCTKAGGDRQALHEKIREYSKEAKRLILEENKPNDLLERIKADPAFKAVHADLDTICAANRFIGRCPEQVDDYCIEILEPLLASMPKPESTVKVELRV